MRWNKQRWCATLDLGQSLVLVALMMPVLVGFLGLGIDYGRLAVERRNLQNIADAAAMAGIPDLPESTSQATTDATSYLTKNGYVSGSNGAASPQITYSTQHAANDTIRVSLRRTVPLNFLPVLGVSSKDVTSAAQALEGGVSAGFGVAPIAVDASLQGDTSGLQPAGGQGNGNYVNVALLNTAAFGSHQDFFNALQNGVNDQISIGGSYATSAPDDSRWRSSVVAVMQARINAGQARGDTHTSFTANSPQLMIVPTVNGGFPNAPSPIVVYGFRAFFITSVDPQGNFARGYFVSAPLVNASLSFSAPAGGVSTFKMQQ